MGAGRAAAQASHAANAFIHKYGNKTDVKEWQKQTPQGFGTAIVLAVNDEKQLMAKTTEASNYGFFADEVIDPDYVISVSKEVVPFIDDRNLAMFEPSPTDPNKYLFHRKEVTCSYIFGDKEKLSEFLGDLPLYS
jgi:hypothetical protein